MRKVTVGTVALIFSVAAVATGQNPRQAPIPSPEHTRLGYFVGNWRTDAEVKPGPFSPGGTFTSTDHSEWLDGGFFVVTRATSTLPTGKQVQLSVLGYDARQKGYTFVSFNNAGVRSSAMGTVEGDTWTWTSSESMGPQTLQVKQTITMLSPSAYTFKFETSTDGKTWSSLIEGKTTKIE